MKFFIKSFHALDYSKISKNYRIFFWYLLKLYEFSAFNMKVKIQKQLIIIYSYSKKQVNAAIDNKILIHTKIAQF